MHRLISSQFGCGINPISWAESQSPSDLCIPSDFVHHSWRKSRFHAGRAGFNSAPLARITAAICSRHQYIERRVTIANPAEQRQWTLMDFFIISARCFNHLESMSFHRKQEQGKEKDYFIQRSSSKPFNRFAVWEGRTRNVSSDVNQSIDWSFNELEMHFFSFIS